MPAGAAQLRLQGRGLSPPPRDPGGKNRAGRDKEARKWARGPAGKEKREGEKEARRRGGEEVGKEARNWVSYRGDGWDLQIHGEIHAINPRYNALKAHGG